MTTLHRVLRAPALLALVFLAGSSTGDELPAADSGEKAGVAAETRGELSGYTDTNAVSVWSPSVAATLKNPLAGWSASANYLVDVVSAASVDIVSTASRRWRETRQAASLSGTVKPKTFGVTAAGSVSREPDYLSLTGGASALVELSNKTVTPSLGYSYGHDTAGLTGTSFDVYALELDRHSVNAAVELVLDPNTLVTLVADGVFERGRQEKPYRFLPLFLPGVQLPAGASVDQVNAVRLPGRIGERDPDARDRYAFTARLAQRLKGSTLVVSERLYGDDWGLKASTTDIRLLFDMSRRVFFWAHVRGHIQSGVSFYERLYLAAPSANGVVVPRYRTGDRELSPLASGTVGAGIRWFLGGGERHDAWSLLLHSDFTATSFSDALFIKSREALFSALQVEASF